MIIVFAKACRHTSMVRNLLQLKMVFQQILKYFNKRARKTLMTANAP